MLSKASLAFVGFLVLVVFFAIWLTEFYLILLPGFLFVFIVIASSIVGVAIAQIIDL